MSSKKYQDLCRGSKTRFRRYTGVSTFVFELMVLLVRQYEEETKIKTGRPVICRWKTGYCCYWSIIGKIERFST